MDVSVSGGRAGVLGPIAPKSGDCSLLPDTVLGKPKHVAIYILLYLIFPSLYPLLFHLKMLAMNTKLFLEPQFIEQCINNDWCYQKVQISSYQLLGSIPGVAIEIPR